MHDTADRRCTKFLCLPVGYIPTLHRLKKEGMNSIHQELFAATKENNLPEVRRLLSGGADVNARDHDDWTPLYWACIKGHLQVFQALREHGANVEAATRFGQTPLHLACHKGHLAVVIELLSPNDINGTATSILGKRKRQGANIEAKDRNGNTALHFACFNDQLPVVKALLSGGADILAATDEGELPIHLAVGNGHSKVSKCLLQHIYAKTRRLPLHGIVEDLTFEGNPNCRDYPPLRAALDRDVLGTDDVVEILEYLVDRDPTLLSSRDEDGSLPLHLACRRGASFAIVQSLVNLYKASVKSLTPQGDLPLFLACEMPEPSLDTIFLLMKLYPDLV
jgi:ankyrin repeat protein